ncbi:MAG: HipA N-terminal domain-containing protein [Clostridia bacterium]|nr:HipA N-terminal domain-containing protein [Clostridia bacterium]
MIDNIKKVTVKHNGKTVGYLAETEPFVIAFQYDENWIRSGFPISPFSLPLSDKVYRNNERDRKYLQFVKIAEQIDCRS